MTADKNPVVCAGGTVCFEVYLDAHVAYPTSLLPHSLDVTYSLQDISNIVVKSGLLKLTLENSSGVYHGRVCYTFIQNPPNEFQFWVEPTNYFWNPDVPGAYKIYLAPASTVQSHVGCGPNVGSPKKDIKLGLNCASLGIVQNTSAIKVQAKDFIEIYPDGQMEIVTNSDQTIGAHFFINPCLLTSFQNDSLPPDIVEERTMADSATLLVRPDVTLQVFPNPFSHDVTIRYTLPADCPGDATLYLRDFMGRQIKTLERRVNAAPGAYQVVFDGGALPPGIYVYELVICNGTQLVKKVEKISF